MKQTIKRSCGTFFWRDQVPWEWKTPKKVGKAEGEMGWLGG